jgi:hypothetical protein
LLRTSEVSFPVAYAELTVTRESVDNLAARVDGRVPVEDALPMKRDARRAGFSTLTRGAAHDVVLGLGRARFACPSRTSAARFFPGSLISLIGGPLSCM